MYSYVFQRFEYKYLLTEEQYELIFPLVEMKLKPDEFGETVVQSLYYDTPDFRLIRASIDKPVFKEKIRLRSYGMSDGGAVFLEMKRKYDGLVYKRRIALDEDKADRIMSGDFVPEDQIEREVAYFTSQYSGLEAKALIICDRSAYFGDDGLRVTFDRDPRYRLDALNLHTSLEGRRFFDDGTVIMEIKSGTAIPLWLCGILSRFGIRKTSFSKYGTVYRLEYLHAHVPDMLKEGD